MMNRFDWHSDPIGDDTLIDQHYKSTQNVRRYFRSRCGEHFSFDRSFMLWMKENPGKTMGQAVSEWSNRQSTR